MTRAIVIPARYASVRLPGKPLLAETGKPLIQHVYERAATAPGFDRVVVATDDPRIADAVRGFGGEAVMTRDDHRSGTDRVCEVAEGLDAGVIVNLQGDEPEIEPEHISRVAGLLDDGTHPMATLVSPIGSLEMFTNPDVVKAVVSDGRALYFSRSPIPFQRDGGAGVPMRYQHLGLYAYTRDALREWPTLQPTPLERAESLEQLRALENGWTIAVAVVEASPPGIDNPDDYAAFVARVRG